MPQLSRALVGLPPAEVRLVHLGIGAFHRAHQAWYTARASAPDQVGWGIHGFTGRTPNAARILNSQDGLYTLLTKNDGDVAAEIMTPIVDCSDGSDEQAWRRAVVSPELTVVTLTITENGYVTTANGAVDHDSSAIRRDIARLRADEFPQTAVARLLDGLRARQRADSGPLAVMSCDNIPENGAVLARILASLAEEVDPALGAWIVDNVSFPSSMVDRITPALTPADQGEALRMTGFGDECPVVTEEFTEWIFAGDFPAGRPEWERGGAQHVVDAGPFEQRKLRLLNGAHSLLAYIGIARGHSTIGESMTDEYCTAWLERWWLDSRPTIEGDAGDLNAFTDRLLSRFSNTGIEHSLRQIAQGGERKIALRVLPVLRMQASVGRESPGAAMALAAWIDFAHDSAPGQERARVINALKRLDPELVEHHDVVSSVVNSLEEIGRQTHRKKMP